MRGFKARSKYAPIEGFVNWKKPSHWRSDCLQLSLWRVIQSRKGKIVEGLHDIIWRQEGLVRKRAESQGISRLQIRIQGWLLLHLPACENNKHLRFILQRLAGQPPLPVNLDYEEEGAKTTAAEDAWCSVSSAVWSVWLTIYRVDSSANTILTNTRFTPMIIRLFVGESWEFLRHSWLRSHRRTSIDPRGCFKTVTIHVSSSHDQHDQCTCYDYLLLGWGECYRRSHYFQWRESPSVSDQRWIIHRNLVWDPK